MAYRVKVVINNDQKAVKVPKGMRMLVRRCCNAVLQLENFDGCAEIGITFTDNEGIRKLNKQYHDSDTEIDAISFPKGDKNIYTTDTDTNTKFLGDVVISMEKAEFQSAVLGHSLQREIGYLTAHGVLQLFGYNYTGAMNKVRMREKEEWTLEQLGFAPSSSYALN
ncbi:MAG: rRNA maturation RNase YbeY [Ruminococcus sp.]|nr:rRNA maturation RNase YbeY [Ruminococcus sp.]